MNKAFAFYQNGVLYKKAVQTKTNSSILYFRNSGQDFIIQQQTFAYNMMKP